MLLCQESHRLVHTSPPAGKSRLTTLLSSKVKHQALDKAVRLPSLRSRPPLARLDHQNCSHRRSLCLSLLHRHIVMIKLRLLLDSLQSVQAPVNGLFRKLVMERHLGLSDANAPIKSCPLPTLCDAARFRSKKSTQR